jgi:hypothetical protein
MRDVDPESRHLGPALVFLVGFDWFTSTGRREQFLCVKPFGEKNLSWVLLLMVRDS